MRGAKTACAFAPEMFPPMGAGMVWVWVFPYGGGARYAVFSPMPNGEKIFLKIAILC